MPISSAASAYPGAAFGFPKGQSVGTWSVDADLGNLHFRGLAAYCCQCNVTEYLKLFAMPFGVPLAVFGLWRVPQAFPIRPSCESLRATVPPHQLSLSPWLGH